MPGSIFELSTFTGALATLALALGRHDFTNGIDKAATPAAAVKEVAVVRNLRRVSLTSVIVLSPAYLLDQYRFLTD